MLGARRPFLYFETYGASSSLRFGLLDATISSVIEAASPLPKHVEGEAQTRILPQKIELGSLCLSLNNCAMHFLGLCALLAGVDALVPPSRIIATSPKNSRVRLHGASVKISYCQGCRWMLRSAYFAQELLTTFDGGELDEVTLAPQFDAAGAFTARAPARDDRAPPGTPRRRSSWTAR